MLNAMSSERLSEPVAIAPPAYVRRVRAEVQVSVTKFRAVGTGPSIIRASFVPCLVVPVVIAATGGYPGEAVLAGLGGAVVVWTISRIPRICVSDSQIEVKGYFSRTFLDTSSVYLRLTSGHVLYYRTWNLVVVSEDGPIEFIWITWARHSLSEPWGRPEPPPRARRYVARIEEALAAHGA